MKWRWAKDRFFTWEYCRYLCGEDKFIHFILGFVIQVVGGAISIILNCFWTFTFVHILGWVLWECKDALLPWEKYGWWGGDGFSWRDLIASYLGILLLFILLCGAVVQW